MLKTAFEIGRQRALTDAGLTKAAGMLSKILTNPATIGTVMGAAGNLLAGGDAPAWQRALKGAGAGAAIGFGVRTLPGLLKKVKAFRTPTGELQAGVQDLGWMAPSLLAVPAIMSLGTDDHGAPAAGQSSRKLFRGKR